MSLPAFAVENRAYGNVGFCNMYEGKAPKRLNYGVYDETVHARLAFIDQVVAPTLAAAVRASGGMPLMPIMRRALHMGDEIHNRNVAASSLMFRRLIPQAIRSGIEPDTLAAAADFLTGNEFRLQVEAIVEGFTQLKSDLESEKRAMAGIWKKREKQIDKVILHLTGMQGDIQGIAGTQLPALDLLEAELDFD